ncbi:MAG: branched-chain amino acid ABC transporter permease [Clostridia bacterium]|nr:branched-chain amino acid ABC transporter permease [Clostridia bacterium]
MDILPQLFLDGLVVGFVYALIAVGYTMVYGVLELINFAHGDIFMVGAFVGTEVLVALGRWGLGAGANPWLALILALIPAMAVAAALGVAVERFAYRPLRRSPRLIILISAIGVSFIIEDLVRLIETIHQGKFVLPVPNVFPGVHHFHVPGWASALAIKTNSLVVVGAAVLMMIGLTLFVSRTRAGRAMRAVAEDPTTAALQGVDVDRIIALTFLIGSAMGGAAGVLFATQYTTITPYIGFLVGIKAFTAAVVGGIGNIPGSFLGGILLGVLEQVGGGFVGAKFQNVFAFCILVAVLVFKPSGLLGEKVQEKV